MMDSSQVETDIHAIRKRSGEFTKFNKDKISNAIFMALSASSKPDRGLASTLADRVVAKLTEPG